MSRLINCLNGFDELVEIKIADNEQIGQIISVIATNLGDKYSVDMHKKLVTEQLTELRYEESVINEWVSFIE